MQIILARRAVGNTWSHPAALQPDAKLVVATAVTQAVPGGPRPSKISWKVRRLLPDGSLDSAFGTMGVVTVSFEADLGQGYPGDDYPKHVALTADGRIVVGGTSLGSGSNCSFGCLAKALLARFTPDGKLDPSFGSNGRVIDGSFATIDSLGIQSDGDIVVASNVGGRAPSNITLHRFRSDGTPDAGFATPRSNCGNGTLRIMRDDRIVIAVSDTHAYSDASATQGLCVIRYLPDGTLDKTFGTSGFVSLKAGNNILFGDFDVDDAGAITVSGRNAGSSFSSTNAAPFVVRLLVDGTPDSTFTETSGPLFMFTALTVDCSNRTIAAALGTSAPPYSFSVARFTSEGSVDALFTSDSSAIARTTADEQVRPTQVLVRPDGKIIVVAWGSPGTPPGGPLYIYQYRGDAPCGTASPGTVVEFYNSILDNYFITVNPARLIDIPKGTLKAGADADVTIIDPDTPWKVDPTKFASKSRNTPYAGWEVRGRAHTVIVAGEVRYTLGGIVAQPGPKAHQTT